VKAAGVLVAGGLIALALLLAQAVLDLAPVTVSLTPAVQAELHASGVAHPVTAVLLNFRAYDTWLELLVLLLAVLAALQGRFRAHPLETPLSQDPLVGWLVLLLVPLAVLVGGYLLKAGAYAPGGAFQAGAALAAGLVLLHLAGWESWALIATSRLTLVLIAGVAFFAAAAFAGLMFYGELLQYPRGHAGSTILVLEIAASVSIAAALALVVAGQVGKDT
jgi:multisubunit Na+/H+ antiporter MnhB subunit